MRILTAYCSGLMRTGRAGRIVAGFGMAGWVKLATVELWRQSRGRRRNVVAVGKVGDDGGNVVGVGKVGDDDVVRVGNDATPQIARRRHKIKLK